MLFEYEIYVFGIEVINPPANIHKKIETNHK